MALDPFQQALGQSEMQDPFEQALKQKPVQNDPFAVALSGTSAPLQNNDSTSTDVQKTIDRPFLSAPLVTTEKTTDTELEQIARKHGVDPETLKGKATFFGAQREKAGLAEQGEEIASSAGRGVGLNLPQLAMKKSESDPKMRSALDDVQALADSKRSMLRGATEQVAGLLTPGGAAKGAALGTKAVIGAGVGALAGLGGSREGSEAKSAAIGAGIGTALAGAGHGVEKYFSNKAASKAEKALLGNKGAADAALVDIEKATQKATEHFGDSEQILSRKGFEGQDIEISQATSRRVLEEQYTPDELTDLLDLKTAEGKVLSRDANKAGITREQQAVNNLIEDRVTSFADDITKGARKPSNLEEAQNIIRDQEARQGTDYVAQRYKQFIDTRNTARILDREASYVGTQGNKVVDVIHRKLGGPQSYLRLMDDNYGVGIRQVQSDLDRATNRQTVVSRVFQKQREELANQLEKEGLSELSKDAGKVISKFEKGGLDALDPQEQKLLRAYKGYTDGVRRFVTEGVSELEGGRVKPTAIPNAGPNYVTHTAVDMPQIITRIETQLDKVNNDLSKLTGRPIRNLADLSNTEYRRALNELPSIQSLVEFDNWKRQDKSAPKTAAELYNSVKQAISTPEGNIALQKVARFSQERIGTIPAIIRENDLNKLMSRYTGDLLSTVYRREPLDKMRQIAARLNKVGATVESKYVEHIIQDVQGIREGTAAALQKKLGQDIAFQLEKRIAKATGIEKKALETVDSFLIHGIPYMLRSIYPNVMGGNPRAVLMNVSQGYARTAPELGGAYGYQAYTKGLMRTLSDRKAFAAALEKSKKLGHMPEEFIRSAETEVSRGIQASAPWKKAVGVNDALAKLSMSAFQMSEAVNRVSILNTADVVARDLVNGNSGALKVISRMPRDMQPVLQAMIQKKDAEGLSRVIGKHLNDATAFNYNKQNMFELGRELGPLFSTFSKWPTEILGEALYDLRSKGLMKGGMRLSEKMLAPLFALVAADHMITSAFDMEDSDRYKKVVGSQGLTGSAPIKSIGSVVKGDIFTPPAVKAIMQGVVRPSMEGNAPSAGKGLDTLAWSFLPGAWVARVLTDDLATYVTGERPEGFTETEKAIEGVRKLSR